MSAHARLQAAANARRALVQTFTILGRADLAEAAQGAPVGFDKWSANVPGILLLIKGEPANGATAVFASVCSRCEFGEKPRVSAVEVHMDAQEGLWTAQDKADWLNIFRFATNAGNTDLAPRTLAKLLATAV